MAKIGIIGLGHVGSHVAYSILHNGLCNELVLIDKDKEKAIAQGYDLVDGSVYYPNQTKIICNDYSALKDADIVVISVAGSIVCESRLKETKTSIECIDEVLPHLMESGFNGIVLSITNPCDIIANYIKIKTGLNVIGSGTTLDSARLKLMIGQRINVNPNSITAYMLGEHGDSQFPYLSNAYVSSIPLLEYAPNLDYEDIIHDTRFRAAPIFASKHCTEFGIGSCATKIIKAILTDSNEILPVSSYVDDYGINHVYMSIPCVVGRNGVKKQLPLKLNDEELKLLQKCGSVIEDNLNKSLNHSF